MFSVLVFVMVAFLSTCGCDVIGEQCVCGGSNNCQLEVRPIQVQRANCNVVRVDVGACAGKCCSYTKSSGNHTRPRGNKPLMSRGSCCSIATFEKMMVPLTCGGGNEEVEIRSATACSCLTCVDP